MMVALRKESVDRNTSIDNLTQGVFKSLSARRAWIEMCKTIPCGGHIRSLSARRAWIEITQKRHPLTKHKVALRKESVDRNASDMSEEMKKTLSLSARRAWIEIYNFGNSCTQAESLSARRAWIEMYPQEQHDSASSRRSPQGERG